MDRATVIGDVAGLADQQDGAGRQHNRSHIAYKGQVLAIDLCDSDSKTVWINIQAATRTVDDIDLAGTTARKDRILIDREGVIGGNRRIILVASRVPALAPVTGCTIIAAAIRSIVVATRGVGIEGNLVERIGTIQLRSVAERMRHDFTQFIQRSLVLEKVKAGLADPDCFVGKRRDDPFVAIGIDATNNRPGRRIDQHITADMPCIGVRQYRELANTQLAVDENLGRGAANAHGRNRRDDLHVAVRRDLARHKHERALDQVKDHRALAGGSRIKDQLIENHPGIGRHGKHGIVDEGDPEFRAVTRLDNVALVNRLTDRKNGLRAIAVRCRRFAFERLNLADLQQAGNVAILGILPRRKRSGEQGDGGTGKKRPIGRNQVWW